MGLPKEQRCILDSQGVPLARPARLEEHFREGFEPRLLMHFGFCFQCGGADVSMAALCGAVLRDAVPALMKVSHSGRSAERHLTARSGLEDRLVVGGRSPGRDFVYRVVK